MSDIVILQGQARRDALIDGKMEILPDGRLPSDKGERYRGGVLWKPAFCINCGKPDGLVMEGTTSYAGLCTQCQESHGVKAGAMATAAEVEMAQEAQRLLDENPKLATLCLAAAMSDTPEAEAAVAAELAAVMSTITQGE